MNHMRNIKELLSIPTGGRNVATSGYSSFTDSQVFFGSQFWPENSQSLSQDMSLSSMASQQSLEENEQKFANTYHTKPLLFGELKDRSKSFGILDKFEEGKKRAKDKGDSDILIKECQKLQETLNAIQQLVCGTERNTAVCHTVLEKFENFVSTLQSSFSSLQGDISQRMESLMNEVSSQKEKMTELERRIQKSGEATAEFGSNLQKLKNSLDCLREDQKRGHSLIEETLQQLSTFVSEHSAKPNTKRMMDISIQTSPTLFSEALHHNSLEATKLTCVSRSLGHNQSKILPHDRSHRRRKLSPRCQKRKKRPLVLSQRSKHTDENCRPESNCNKQQKVPQCKIVTNQDSVGIDCLKQPKRDRSRAGGCLITPLSCWSQDSNSSLCLQGMEPILEKLPAESRTGTTAKPAGLWQLFDMDSDSVLGF